MNKPLTFSHLLIIAALIFVVYYIWMNLPSHGKLPQAPTTINSINKTE